MPLLLRGVGRWSGLECFCVFKLLIFCDISVQVWGLGDTNIDFMRNGEWWAILWKAKLQKRDEFSSLPNASETRFTNVSLGHQYVEILGVGHVLDMATKFVRNTFRGFIVHQSKFLPSVLIGLDAYSLGSRLEILLSCSIKSYSDKRM